MQPFHHTLENVFVGTHIMVCLLCVGIMVRHSLYVSMAAMVCGDQRITHRRLVLFRVILGLELRW